MARQVSSIDMKAVAVRLRGFVLTGRFVFDAGFGLRMVGESGFWRRYRVGQFDVFGACAGKLKI